MLEPEEVFLLLLLLCVENAVATRNSYEAKDMIINEVNENIVFFLLFRYLWLSKRAA